MITWIKNNKLSTFLIVLLLLGGFNTFFNGPIQPLSLSRSAMNGSAGMSTFGISAPTMEMNMKASDSYQYQESAPTTGASNRMVVQNSFVSLVVKSVNTVAQQIITLAQNQGGYMVDSSIPNPDEAASATVTIRIPAEKLDAIRESLKKMAIKVVSENLTGYDVTDQYVDNDARLATLRQTQAKFQAIFEQATEIQDIIQVQNELINIQSQIDAIKGQQQYLSQNAKLAKLTVYLSTDELELPYAPQDSWRPNVIFKEAVRSLIGTFRGLGSMIIWLAVYSIVIIPVIIVLWYTRRLMIQKKTTKKWN